MKYSKINYKNLIKNRIAKFNKITIVAHRDTDGMFSAITLAKNLKGKKIAFFFVNYGEIPSLFHHPWLRFSEFVIMCDLDLKNPSVYQAQQIFFNVLFIDHHRFNFHFSYNKEKISYFTNYKTSCSKMICNIFDEENSDVPFVDIFDTGKVINNIPIFFENLIRIIGDIYEVLKIDSPKKINSFEDFYGHYVYLQELCVDFENYIIFPYINDNNLYDEALIRMASMIILKQFPNKILIFPYNPQPNDKQTRLSIRSNNNIPNKILGDYTPLGHPKAKSCMVDTEKIKEILHNGQPFFKV